MTHFRMFQHEQNGTIEIGDYSTSLAEFLLSEPDYGLPEGMDQRRYQPGISHTISGPGGMIIGESPWIDGDRYLQKASEGVYQAEYEARHPEIAEQKRTEKLNEIDSKVESYNQASRVAAMQLQLLISDSGVVASSSNSMVGVTSPQLKIELLTFANIESPADRRNFVLQSEAFKTVSNLDNLDDLLWSAIKFKRNSLLMFTDWTQSPDNRLTPEQKMRWAEYRDRLRDISSTSQMSPVDLEWPMPPSKVSYL